MKIGAQTRARGFSSPPDVAPRFGRRGWGKFEGKTVAEVGLRIDPETDTVILGEKVE